MSYPEDTDSDEPYEASHTNVIVSQSQETIRKKLKTKKKKENEPIKVEENTYVDYDQSLSKS